MKNHQLPAKTSSSFNPMGATSHARKRPVSKETIYMAGLLVDVYGLAELAATATKVSCLWLHHPRGAAKEHMGNMASECINEWNSPNNDLDREAKKRNEERGLIGLAFDQRNHGSRSVHEAANRTWIEGNPQHAQDMFGVITGTVADQSLLLDAVGGYLFHLGEKKRDLDHHIVLGVSLGGHSAWQTLFREPRADAGVVVIGCPDYMYLLSHRARLSRLSPYLDNPVSSIFGSKDFPPSLVDACCRFDPKGILFGTGPVYASTTSNLEAAAAANKLLGKKKKILVCSGGADKLVPYQCSESFLDWLKSGQVDLELTDIVYDGVGHAFSEEMVGDAVSFVVGAVAGGSESEEAKAEGSKI